MVEPSFVEPQPANKSDQKDFKKKYQGSYSCLEDSSRLIISENKIVQDWKIDFGISRTEVDTSNELSYSNGMLYTDDSEAPIAVEVVGDSVFGVYELSNTIFEISGNSILRFYKGRYFLNKQNSANDWNVKILELSGDRLGLYRISGVEQIESLSEYTEVKEVTNEQDDIIDYELNPSRKELRSILKASKFNEGTNFRKTEKR